MPSPVKNFVPGPNVFGFNDAAVNNPERVARFDLPMRCAFLRDDGDHAQFG